MVRAVCSVYTDHPFDLTRDVLLRAMLLRLDEEEHVILLVTHHISYDGWSTGVFVREVEALYRGCREGVLPELPELPIQYADFTVWQREHLQGKVYAGHLDYWRKRLAGAPQGLNLPMARTRPAEQTFRGDREFFSATRELTDRLKALSQQEQVTLFTTLLSAFKSLIHRYTGQRDVVVGTPIANRNRTEIEGLVGFFSNTLVLRTDLAGDPTFRQLMARFHEVAMEAAEHQDMPFDQLVRELQPERHLDRNPMFQVMFNVQNAPMENPRLGEVDIEPFFFDITITHFDISFYIWDTPRGLRGMFNYSTDLFDQAAVRLMLGHYTSPAERDRILSFTTSPLRKGKLPAHPHGRFRRTSQRLEKTL